MLNASVVDSLIFTPQGGELRSACSINTREAVRAGFVTISAVIRIFVQIHAFVRTGIIRIGTIVSTRGEIVQTLTHSFAAFAIRSAFDTTITAISQVRHDIGAFVIANF